MRSTIRDKSWESLGVWRPPAGQLCITVCSAFNWRAEQSIRPAVVMRKVCGGNRSARDAQTQYILASLLRTAYAEGNDRKRGNPRPGRFTIFVMVYWLIHYS